jgi:hypothetical protein
MFDRCANVLLQCLHLMSESETFLISALRRSSTGVSDNIGGHSFFRLRCRKKLVFKVEQYPHLAHLYMVINSFVPCFFCLYVGCLDFFE